MLNSGVMPVKAPQIDKVPVCVLNVNQHMPARIFETSAG
jgi:hypothetical protein